MELIFRGTKDGMNANNFHNKCDNQGETITLIKNGKGCIFGGYTSIPWTSSQGSYFSSHNSFLFTLTNIYGTEPNKFISKNDQNEVYHNISYGPRFGAGCDLGIYTNFVKDGGWSNFPNTYQDNIGKGKSIFTGDLNNENPYFTIKEIEIFKLLK